MEVLEMQKYLVFGLGDDFRLPVCDYLGENNSLIKTSLKH